MNEIALRELGLSDGLIRHLGGNEPSAPLGFRVQPPEHWQSSPISRRSIITLWECGTTLTYFDQDSATYRRCSLEDINSDWFRYRSLQALLAQLFLELYEDELSDDQILSVAVEAGFHHAERLIEEASGLNGSAYQRWSEAFPLTCEP
jgi:hypothetical protein